LKELILNKKSLIACGLVFALNAQNIQDEIKLAIKGEWKGHQKGSFEITINDLNQMKDNFEKQKVDLVIDLDHFTIDLGTAEAQGWIKELYIKDEELWAKVEWLEHGKELVKSGKYKYISPVFQENTIDPQTGENIGWTIHSAALTNRPFLEDLGEVVANNKPNSKKGESGMTPEEKKEMADLKAKVEDFEKKEAAAEVARVEKEVDDAIAANKVNKDQKDSLITLGKANPEELTKLLAAAKPIVSKPEDNLYQNNNNNSASDKNTLSKEELEA